jgi:hypothetical protein
MRKTTAALITAATTAIATGAGLATASASPAASASSGTEHFYLMTTSGTSNRSSLIAEGVFTAAGVDISGSSTDTVQLPGGTFKIHHSGGPSGAPKVNPATCFTTLTVTDPFSVNGGTGKYKGLTGSGTAVISIIAILARSHGACTEDANPVAWHQTITGTAHVHL